MGLLTLLIIGVITVIYSCTNKSQNFNQKILYNSETNNKEDKPDKTPKVKSIDELPKDFLEKEEVLDDFLANEEAEAFIRSVKDEVKERR